MARDREPAATKDSFENPATASIESAVTVWPLSQGGATTGRMRGNAMLIANRHSEMTVGLPTTYPDDARNEHPVAAHVEEEFRSYPRYGILCVGFARSRWGSCGHDFLVAFSCKGRAIYPSCDGRRMAQTSAHIVDHVIPPVPIRQSMISIPKRLPWFLGERPESIAPLARIFMSEVERLVREAASVPSLPTRNGAAPPRIGGISLHHRFGSALNYHIQSTLGSRSMRACRAPSCRVSTCGAMASFYKSLEHLVRYCARS